MSRSCSHQRGRCVCVSASLFIQSQRLPCWAFSDPRPMVSHQWISCDRPYVSSSDSNVQNKLQNWHPPERCLSVLRDFPSGNRSRFGSNQLLRDFLRLEVFLLTKQVPWRAIQSYGSRVPFGTPQRRGTQSGCRGTSGGAGPRVEGSPAHSPCLYLSTAMVPPGHPEGF